MSGFLQQVFDELDKQLWHSNTIAAIAIIIWRARNRSRVQDGKICASNRRALMALEEAT